MKGSRSASSTALPRIRAATATDIDVLAAIPVLLSIKTRISATICKATKKKMVGGIMATNSSFIFAAILPMVVLSAHRYPGPKGQGVHAGHGRATLQVP